MKNRFLLLAWCCLSLLLAGCQERRVYKIGVSQCSSDDWRNKCNEEIYREMIFHPDAEVEIRSAEDNNEKQIADIRYFADNGFDIIIVAPNEADAITPIIKEVYGRGIPVVTFDRNIHGDSYTAYQGVDNKGIGMEAARYARLLVGTGGKIVEVYGLPGSTPAIERHEGFVKELDQMGMGIQTTVYGNWNYEDAAAACDSLFSQYKDADLLFAHNDRMAVAAAETAKRHGLRLKVIGVDAAPELGIKAVADSVIDATLLYPTEGYRLIRTAMAILKGKPYERQLVLPKSSVVDLSNADILLLQNETLKEETDKVRKLKLQVDDYLSRHATQTYLLYASVVFLLLIAGVLSLLLHAYWQRKRYQQELLKQNKLLEQQRDKQKELNAQLQAATQSKLVFFTNVSHDLRTPLTLIAEPVEQMVNADNLTPLQHNLMRIAGKNIRILKRLINQILDFRKYENGKLELARQEVRFAGLVEEWAESFVTLTRKHDIRLQLDIKVAADFTLAIDVGKMERVFFNLMSNAFKHTPQGGQIVFACSNTETWLTFSVKDTGKGIGAEELGKIFDRFYQVDKIHPNGSGIGLSLVKAFVELHGGTISAESQPGEGVNFIVHLPIMHTAAEAAPEPAPGPAASAREVEEELDSVEPECTGMRPDDPLLLVIDDNEDIRRLITLLMQPDYNVITAANGADGVRLAAKYVPDLVICDVLMPGMDGMECTHRIKSEISTSHIPVLLLTACTLDEQRQQGYECGADGYLSKPFNGAVLRARCSNLIENRQRVKQLWTAAGTATEPAAGAPLPATSGDVENEFYTRLLDIIKRDMHDSELNVDTLAAKMGLGRSQFYRKIKALTNHSPVELLRKLRLKRSRELLLTTEKTISEVAYEVGFTSPAYFTRCYREAFGETPTEMRERMQVNA